MLNLRELIEICDWININVPHDVGLYHNGTAQLLMALVEQELRYNGLYIETNFNRTISEVTIAAWFSPEECYVCNPEEQDTTLWSISSDPSVDEVLATKVKVIFAARSQFGKAIIATRLT